MYRSGIYNEWPLLGGRKRYRTFQGKMEADLVIIQACSAASVYSTLNLLFISNAGISCCHATPCMTTLCLFEKRRIFPTFYVSS